jgi:hypothetical protein
MKTIWNWIVGEVRTVETIIANFRTTINELENHAEQKLREAFHHRDVANAAHAAEAVAADEADKAKAVAKKISALVA